MTSLIRKLFDGKKSYLTGGALVALGLAVAFGYAQLPAETFEGLAVALAGAVTVFLRMAIAKWGSSLPDGVADKIDAAIGDSAASAPAASTAPVSSEQPQ